MGLDGGGDLLIIIEEVDTQSACHEDAGYQCRCLHTFRSRCTGAVGTLAQQQSAGNDHDRLAQLIGKVAGCQEHTCPVFAGFDGIILGKVRKHRGRDDIGDGNGHGNTEADDDGESRTADEGDHRFIAVDTAVQAYIGNAGTQQQGLLAHLPGQHIHQRIGADTHTDGNDGDDDVYRAPCGGQIEPAGW